MCEKVNEPTQVCIRYKTTVMIAANSHREWASLAQWPTDTLAHIFSLSPSHTQTHAPVHVHGAIQQRSPVDKWTERHGVTAHWALRSFNEAYSQWGPSRRPPVCSPSPVHKLERARPAELARTRGAVWADEEQLWDGDGWTIVGKT